MCASIGWADAHEPDPDRRRFTHDSAHGPSLAHGPRARSPRFIEAASGLEAIERLALGAVELMVLDLNMPDMHGLEVLGFVRSHQKYARVPVIVLTTRGDDASRSAAMQAGATAFLTKPFLPQVAGRPGKRDPARARGAGCAVTTFKDDFLDEYFAECGEHLAVVRRGLLSLEQSVGRSRPDTAITEELFRSFHSLKGLAGMVEDPRRRAAGARDGELSSRHPRGRRTPDDTWRRGADRRHALRSNTPSPRAAKAAVRPTAARRWPACARSSGTPPPRARQTAASITAARRPTLVGMRVHAVAGADRARRQRRSRAGATARAWRDPQRRAAGRRRAGRGIPVPVRRLLSTKPRCRGVERGRHGVLRAIADAPAADLERARRSLPLPRRCWRRATTCAWICARLDELMRMIGDLVILRARLGDALSRVEAHVPAGGMARRPGERRGHRAPAARAA